MAENKEFYLVINLKWEQAAVKIADLIDEENYLNDEEKEEYNTLVRFRETVELSAKDFCEEVRGKDAGAYGADYNRPSVVANTSFDEKEKALRTAVPDEMKARPNWAVIKTWWNADKGKYNKRPVNC